MNTSKEDFALRRRQLQAMMDEYERELASYDAWMKAWKARQPKGFRANRRKRAEDAA